MQKAWSAEGLLLPLWSQYPGKRDGLARAIGCPPGSLSRVNRGRENLGVTLGSKIVRELNKVLSTTVSLQDLGAPEDADWDAALTLVQRVEALEAENERFLKVILDAFLLLGVELVTPSDGQEPTVRQRSHRRGRHER